VIITLVPTQVTKKHLFAIIGNFLDLHTTNLL